MFGGTRALAGWKESDMYRRPDGSSGPGAPTFTTFTKVNQAGANDPLFSFAHELIHANRSHAGETIAPETATWQTGRYTFTRPFEGKDHDEMLPLTNRIMNEAGSIGKWPTSSDQPPKDSKLTPYNWP